MAYNRLFHGDNLDVLRTHVGDGSVELVYAYPTQKPLALLERVIAASSNDGDLVLDPFRGCSTTLAAADRLNRSWIGIDIAATAIELTQQRVGTTAG